MRHQQVTEPLSAPAAVRSSPARRSLPATALALGLCVVLAGLTINPAPSLAGVDASICRSETSRVSAAKFALPVCFDGKTLIVRNDSEYPVRIVGSGSAGEPYQQPYAGVPGASSLVLTYIRPGDNSLLMPGYQLRIPIGPDAASLRLAGTDLATTYAVLKTISSVLPTQAVTPIIDAVGQLATELVDVWSEHQACTARNGWLGKIGCDALYNRNVAFAVGRAVATGAAGAVTAAVLNLLSTASWATKATDKDSAQLLGQARGGSDGTITIAKAAASRSNTPAAGTGGAAPAPAPDPGPAPTGPLRFSVTGSCTTDAGTLSASSSGFTPGGTVRINAWRPNGSSYTNLIGTGRVRSNGSAPWTWPCAGDPPGTYTTEVVDTTTGRNTGRIQFAVGAGRSTPAPRPTWTEQSGSHGSPTFRNPSNASGRGPTVPAMTYVEVTCKIRPATTIASANPDGYWYRIASAPWNNDYYAVANTFWNGDAPGQKPYTHNTDWNVPDC